MPAYGNPAFRSPYADPMERLAGGINDIAMTMVRSMPTAMDRDLASARLGLWGAQASKEQAEADLIKRRIGIFDDAVRNPSLPRSVIDATALATTSNPDQITQAVTEALKQEAIRNLGGVTSDSPTTVAQAFRAPLGNGDIFKVDGGTRLNTLTGAMDPTEVGQSDIRKNDQQAGLYREQGVTETNKRGELDSRSAANRALARERDAAASLKGRTDPNRAGRGAGKPPNPAQMGKLRSDIDKLIRNAEVETGGEDGPRLPEQVRNAIAARAYEMAGDPESDLYQNAAAAVQMAMGEIAPEGLEAETQKQGGFLGFGGTEKAVKVRPKGGARTGNAPAAPPAAATAPKAARGAKASGATWTHPSGRVVTKDEIDATAKNRGMTPEEVIRRLGLVPNG